MSTRNELKDKLGNFVATAVNLANSVADDLQEQRSISDETVLLLNNFKKQEQELEVLLDIVNGLQ